MTDHENLELMRTLFHYDSETGNLWRTHILTGKVYLTANPGLSRYRKVKIGKEVIYAHRLIWFILYGFYPINDIDHINGNKKDNRLCNLREATRSQNKANEPKRKRKGCSSKYKGVNFIKASKRWRASGVINMKFISLGTFANEIDAATAYNRFAMETFGEFALVNNIEKANNE